MISLMERNKIVSLANDLRSDSGVEGEYPVPCEKIVAHIGYKWHYFSPSMKLKDVSGAVDHDKKIIYTNNKEPFGRQRFTVAHEIGHVILRHPGNIVDRRGVINEPGNDIEYSANVFAAELIMPKDEFERVWVENNENIKIVADYFGVSYAAVFTRFKVLGL